MTVNQNWLIVCKVFSTDCFLFRIMLCIFSLTVLAKYLLIYWEIWRQFEKIRKGCRVWSCMLSIFFLRFMQEEASGIFICHERIDYRAGSTSRIRSIKKCLCLSKDCLAKQVLPPLALSQFKFGKQPLTNSVRILIVKATRTPHHRLYKLRNQLQQDDQSRRFKHNTKLYSISSKSSGSKAGRSVLRNMSSKRLPHTKKEALSFGLHLGTGQHSKDWIDNVISNHRWTDSDVDKGITAYCMADASSRSPAIQRRYIQGIYSTYIDLG